MAAKSELLNVELPPDLASLARDEGISPERAWLLTGTDLNLEGQYEPVFLLAEPTRLVILGRPRQPGRCVRLVLDRNEVREIRTRSGVGGGFLEALVGGVYMEILAYSNARADVFHKVTRKLEDWIEGTQPEVNAEDDYDPRRCTQCGMPLQFKGDTCRRCIRPGAVLLRVLKLMKPYTKWAVAMMALVLVSIGLSLVPQRLIRVLIDHVLAPEQAGHTPLSAGAIWYWLLGLVGALFGARLLMALIAVLNGRLSNYVGTQMTFDVRSRVFAHLTRQGVDYYDRYSVGKLMTRVNNDTAQLHGFVQQLTNGFLAQIIRVGTIGVVLFMLNWKLALITLLPAPLVVISAVFFWKRIYPRHHRVWDARSKLNGVLNTILSGVRVVKAFGQEPRERQRYDRASGRMRDNARSVQYAVSTFNPMMGLLFQLGGMAVWYVGGLGVLGQGVLGGDKLTLGMLMQFLGYLGMFFQPLRQLTQLTNWFTSFLTSTQRVFEILDTTPQIREADQPKRLPADKPTTIEFKHVTFGYHRHEPVIRDVSFAIAPGEHIGVVGKSGSGKTTLVNLLGRFYDVDDGAVLLGGVDVRELSMDDIRKRVGIVLQQPFLFRGTIYENITYGATDATPEQVVAAAKSANAHDFIMRRPLGYDTYIGERGAGLSGGERQRVSIARALLYDPQILILDEATSSVDTESEQLIQQALERVTQGRTTLAIAHRLSTLRNADRIIVVDGGRIVERGSHEELLELGGLYYRLVKIQTELSRGPTVDSLSYTQTTSR